MCNYITLFIKVLNPHFISLVSKWSHVTNRAHYFGWWVVLLESISLATFYFYILLVLTICSLIRFILQPINRYSYRFYNIENKNIEILNTFIFKRYKTTKIERLQLLKVKTNPLLKQFNLKRIIVVTAGHELTTPVVSNKEAERLILHILSQMRGSNDDI